MSPRPCSDQDGAFCLARRIVLSCAVNSTPTGRSHNSVQRFRPAGMAVAVWVFFFIHPPLIRAASLFPGRNVRRTQVNQQLAARPCPSLWVERAEAEVSSERRLQGQECMGSLIASHSSSAGSRTRTHGQIFHGVCNLPLLLHYTTHISKFRLQASSKLYPS